MKRLLRNFWDWLTFPSYLSRRAQMWQRRCYQAEREAEQAAADNRGLRDQLRLALLRGA